MCDIPTQRCKFPAEEIMGAHNVNFDTEWGISTAKFVLLEENFPAG